MMSSPEEQQRQATLLELARELCAVIERGEITAEEGATRIFDVWPRRLATFYWSAMVEPMIGAHRQCHYRLLTI
jgi:hypothetical protein